MGSRCLWLLRSSCRVPGDKSISYWGLVPAAQAEQAVEAPRVVTVSMAQHHALGIAEVDAGAFGIDGHPLW